MHLLANKKALSRFESAQGEQNCPWFHLNSCLADTHFVPGNGGDRRAISCPRSRGPSRRAFGGFSPSILSLKSRLWGTVPCRRFGKHFMIVLPLCQGNFHSFLVSRQKINLIYGLQNRLLILLTRDPDPDRVCSQSYKRGT